MKIALIYSDTKISARLTQIFAGATYFAGTPDYHITFVSDDEQTMWDQHWLFRREDWQAYSAGKTFDLFQCPFDVTPEELDAEVFTDVRALCGKKPLLDVLYGWRDYIAFALRPIYHALGKSTPNYGGTVCSGRLRDVGAVRGWRELGKTVDAEPSPTDWRRWFDRRPELLLFSSRSAAVAASATAATR